ncbi:hypothetical protein [Ignatzschineria indica]|nr:hypothetical protein [Ignatzschineria indica]
MRSSRDYTPAMGIKDADLRAYSGKKSEMVLSRRSTDSLMD